MMVMTTKVDMKKVLVALAAAAAVILALVLMLGDKKEPAPAEPQATTQTMSTNDTRVGFLSELGWEVAASPKETSQVRIPDTPTEMYERYNALQKSQGYDLTQYAGKNVMRYVYEVKNFPGATQPVYATLLVYKDKIIGGDITDTSPRGAIQSLKKTAQETPAPTEATTPETTGATT